MSLELDKKQEQKTNLNSLIISITILELFISALIAVPLTFLISAIFPDWWGGIGINFLLLITAPISYMFIVTISILLNDGREQKKWNSYWLKMGVAFNLLIISTVFLWLVYYTLTHLTSI